jgi:hypothetical protein
MLNKILVFVFGLVFFYLIIHLPEETDMKLHIQSILEMNNGNEPYPAHFLYFFLVSVLSGFSISLNVVIAVCVLLLSVMLVLKYMVTKQILNNTLIQTGNAFTLFNIPVGKYIIPLTFSLLLLTNMPCKPPWTHELPPISWHNSTVVIVLPLCVLMFWLSYRFLINPVSKLLIYITLLGVLILLIKPNYMFVHMVVFGLFVLVKYKFSKPFWLTVVSMLVFILVLSLQFYYQYVYITKLNITEHYNNVQIYFEPFHAWKKISGNVLLSYLAWTLYPTCFFIVYFKHAVQKFIYSYALSFFVLALLIFIMFTEKQSSGANIGAVNFLWQVIICHYIWFMISLIEHIKIVSERKKIKPQDILLFILFFYYVFSGFMYLVRTVFLRYI